MKPNPVVAREAAYSVPRHAAPIDLKLDGNEGALPPSSLLSAIADPELMRRYPDARPLERMLAARFDLAPDRLLATCGADDALDRACRALLWPGRELVISVPTFEMLPRYAALTGCTQREVPWPTGPYPVDAVLAQVNADTAAIAVVSPNNPTGAIATTDDLERLARHAPQVALLVDAAYGEYADLDLTRLALSLPNAIVFRTLSKAWGLAGLRVGYAMARPEVIGWLRATGHPYALASPSIALASAWLAQGEEPMRRAVAQVRTERTRLEQQLNRRGAEALASQANFVLCRPRDAAWLFDGLAALGISVRIWPKHPKLDGLVRVTCPADEAAFARLSTAIDTVLAPEALLFDLEAVLASPDRGLFARLATRLPLAVISRRGGADVARALASRQLTELFRAVVCSEDARAPDAALGLLLERLSVGSAWLLSHTTLDLAAARATGVVVLGLKGHNLADTGVARELAALDELETMLP